METEIKGPKRELLLGASLNEMHRESREWLENIEFWKDETNFFIGLLSEKQDVFTQYGKVLRNLSKIHKDLFNYLSEDIVEHEKDLSELLTKEKKGSDSEYRTNHQKLKERMSIFTEDFKDFKRMVFGFARKF